MPSFSHALSSILLSSALMTWPITTTTTTAHPLLLRDGGRGSGNEHRRAGTYKNSKKQQNVVQQHCTPDAFAGVYKYVNCKQMVMQVTITCDTENRIKNQCNYKEQPMKDDKGNDVCVVEGSFDATYVRMDPARPDACELNFVSLKDSCKADALPSGFGVRAEVDIMTAGPDDTSSTSTLLLRFSNDRGVVYYNEDEPQKALFLHQDLSTGGRKLQNCPNSDCNKFPQCSTDVFSPDGWCPFKNETAIAAAETAENETKRLEQELSDLQDKLNKKKEDVEKQRKLSNELKEQLECGKNKYSYPLNNSPYGGDFYDYPQCSTILFEPPINFCKDWCNVDGKWPSCGPRMFLSGSYDGRNTFGRDYACDCNGCNDCPDTYF